MTKRKVLQPDLIDLLLADYKKPEDLIGENGILKQLTKEIAYQLDVSVKTVETHRAALMERLDIHDIAGLVLYAVRHGLISVDRPEDA